MTEPRELIRALMAATGRPERDVAAFLDEPQRIAQDMARRAERQRERAKELHRQIREGAMP